MRRIIPTTHKTGRYALLLVLVAVALLAAFAAVARPAAALSDGSYNHGGATCNSCHTPELADARCTTCHTGGFVSSPNSATARTCWTCHTPGQDMSTVQTAVGCSTGAAGAACHNTAGHVGSATKGCTSCHGSAVSISNPDGSRHHVKDALVSGLITLKFNKTRILLGSRITASGLVKPIATGGVKVLVQRKSATGKWVKITIKTLTGTATNTYKWAYKPLRRGSYRMQASVLATSDTRLAKTTFKTFSVR